ncbi:hypothetical protein EDD16DRAFT_1709517 [Pisolithus croceorrhizus]|nr:hypothetical protein EDD16DRAFT_1709517 [Pisolithus croceorrhizus]KAI6151384.1 hypothetical protein EDD17DRAFT_1765601 [Pisolithus thermaeus]
MYQVVKTVDRILRRRFQDAIACFFATLSSVSGLSLLREYCPDEKTTSATTILEPTPPPWTSPVISSAEFAMVETNIVRVNPEGIKRAADYVRYVLPPCILEEAISQKIVAEQYTPRTWRTQPLHICPPEPFCPSNPLTRQCLNWVFIISALNFSFWSERDGTPERYGVEWRKGWGVEERVVHTGYWSLVAAVNRALGENIPITDPAFYSSESLCPDSLIAYIFRAAAQCREPIPLLQERISIMREVGSILCNDFNGSYLGLLESFHSRNSGQGTAFDLAQMVADTFPSFRDEQWLNGRKGMLFDPLVRSPPLTSHFTSNFISTLAFVVTGSVVGWFVAGWTMANRRVVLFWKRAQILVAETWAAFYPENSAYLHPIFPNGPAINTLTMFADYRVPQILHHLRILEYPDFLVHKLQARTYLTSGCRDEVSLRAASIVAVEKLRREIIRLRGESHQESGEAGRGNAIGAGQHNEVSSVLIDFYLWDLAKKIERGEEWIEEMATSEMVPVHRTRSIWY